MIEYNDLVANAVIFSDVVNLTSILRDLSQESYGKDLVFTEAAEKVK